MKKEKFATLVMAHSKSFYPSKPVFYSRVICFQKKYCSKKKQMVKNGLTIILLTGWHKNELSVLECALCGFWEGASHVDIN